MSDKKPVPLIGRLALQLKMLSQDQLSEALRIHDLREHEGRFGDLFVEQGFISPAQLKQLAQVQRDVIAKHKAKKAAEQAAPAAEPAPIEATPASRESTLELASEPGPALELESEPGPAPEMTPDALDGRALDLSEPSPALELESDPGTAPEMTPDALDGRALDLSEPSPALELESDPGPAPEMTPDALDGRALDLSEPSPAKDPAPEPAAKPTPAAEPDPTPAPPAIEADPSALSLNLGVSAPTSEDRDRLHQLLSDAIDAGASDIHIHSGSPLQLRVHGALANMGERPLSHEEVERMVSAALSAEERATLSREGEIDLCYVLPGVGRFRANLYRQQRGFDAVMRTIPNEPPSLEQLGLPATLAKYTQYHQGMVLITGPAGCGKSSTMAALVNLINEQREEHILCVEDPIEYVHSSKKCFVNQRHAGRDTQSFARALRGALREDPDVIVIGELRDLETISLAMTAAETGHFVLATLHTNNAVRTVNRMIGAFPSNQQGQVRTMLSESLRAVISQRLVPRSDESGRVAALEMLVINKAISNLIRDEKTIQIRSAIQTGASQGMCLLEQSLNELVAAGTIDREVALALAEEKKLIQG